LVLLVFRFVALAALKRPRNVCHRARPRHPRWLDRWNGINPEGIFLA